MSRRPGPPRISRPSIPAPVLLLLLVLSSLAAAGCVDLKANAVLASDGSGRLTLDYRVPRALLSMELYQGKNAGLPFPLDRAVLERRAISIPGVTLSRWSREDLDDEIRISTEWRFPSLPSMVQFLDPEGNRIRYSSSNGQRELGFTLSSGTLPPMDAVSWMDVTCPDYTLDLSITLPSRAVSVSSGNLSASRTVARFSSSTSEVVNRSDPLVWTIRW